MVWGGGREVWMGKGLAKQERDWEKTVGVEEAFRCPRDSTYDVV